MKIAFFDSGVGGLTVLEDMMNSEALHHYIYYADTDNVPYGNKTRALIKEYVFEAAAFLYTLQPDILVVACNTATSVVIKDLRAKYDIPVVGMEPAIKPAITYAEDGNIILAATQRTIREKKLERLVHKLGAAGRVKKMPLPDLVTLAEKMKFEGEEAESYIRDAVSDVDWTHVRAFVLGCTHFLYFKPIFKKYIPQNVKIMDGNGGTVKRILSLAGKTDTSCRIEFYDSGRRTDRPEFTECMAFYRSISKAQ